MAQIFWETTQKARGSYFCYRCCNQIGPGETYHRKLWAPQPGTWHVMREHENCPPNEIEEEMHAEATREHEATFSVPLVLEVRMREVVVLSLNGEPTTKQEPTLVATLEPDNFQNSGDDIPF